MVHYIRFLKTARVQHRPSRSLSVITLITITTDPGDSFLSADANLVACLVAADGPRTVLCRDRVRWHKGSRDLLLEIPINIAQDLPLLQLRIFHDKASDSIPSILGALSASFTALAGPHAAPLIMRQLSLPCLPTPQIWEETGNSIAKHIW